MTCICKLLWTNSSKTPCSCRAWIPSLITCPGQVRRALCWYQPWALATVDFRKCWGPFLSSGKMPYIQMKGQVKLRRVRNWGRKSRWAASSHSLGRAPSTGSERCLGEGEVNLWVELRKGCRNQGHLSSTVSSLNFILCFSLSLFSVSSLGDYLLAGCPLDFLQTWSLSPLHLSSLSLPASKPSRCSTCLGSLNN